MSLDRFLDRNAVNKYCKLRNLENESAVEQNLLIPFLDELGFTEDYREPKKTIEEYSLGKGKKRRSMLQISFAIWTYLIKSQF